METEEGYPGCPPAGLDSEDLGIWAVVQLSGLIILTA